MQVVGIQMCGSHGDPDKYSPQRQEIKGNRHRRRSIVGMVTSRFREAFRAVKREEVSSERIKRRHQRYDQRQHPDPQVERGIGTVCLTGGVEHADDFVLTPESR